MKRLRQRYGRAEATSSNPEELPVGSLVWLDGHGWVVVPGGMAPTAILPERAGTFVPAGERVWRAGTPYALVARGSGKVPTHGTAQRKIETWWQTARR